MSAKSHIPNVAAITALKDREIAFLAATGAAMSLAAGLEVSYFRVFQKAVNLAEPVAARVFYAVMNASTRRDMADAAIRPTLSDPARLRWIGIFDRIRGATGGSGHRNLLGHAPVLKQEATEGVFDANIFEPEVFDCGREERFVVAQDEIQILAGKKKPREEDFNSVVNYCLGVIAILEDLDCFMDAYENGDLRTA